MNTVVSDPTTHDADTYGWDTAFAINFTHANKAIIANWDKVDPGAKAFKETSSDDDSYNVDATLGPWQLTVGGDGKNVRLACPITDGAYHAGSHTFNLAGKNTYIVIEVGMEWVPNPGQFNFVITGGDVSTITNDLDGNTIDSKLKDAFTAHGKTLTAAAAAIMVTRGKVWTITDGQTNFYLFYTNDKSGDDFLTIYQYETSWANNLQILKKAAAGDQPAVAIIQIANPPAGGIAGAAFEELASTWFNTNIGEFNYVFAALNLSPVIDQKDRFNWMRPSSTSYAVTDMGTLDSSVFGVLTMVKNNPVPENHQVSPYAIPASADAGFLISGPNFIRYMMLGGAQIIFRGSTEDDFLITNDGLTVQSKNKLLFGKFNMSDDADATVNDRGYSAQLDAKTIPPQMSNDLFRQGVAIAGLSVQVTVAGSQWLLTDGKDYGNEYIVNLESERLKFYKATSLWVDAGKFQMSLNHTWVQIQFIDIYYPASSDFDVHVGYTENVPLSLKTEAGKNIFWMGDSFARTMTVTVAKTKSAITREIVEGAVLAAVALVAFIGPIIEGLASGAEITEVAEAGGQAVIEEGAFETAEADSAEAEADEAAAGEQAAASSSGRITRIKAAFKLPRWKFVAWLSALAGAVSGLDLAIEAIIENAVKNEWENVPGFDDFAKTVIGPYSFPDVPAFTLTSAALAGSLQIGFTVKNS